MAKKTLNSKLENKRFITAYLIKKSGLLLMI